MAPSLDQIEEIQWLTRSEEPIFRADFNFAPATSYLVESEGGKVIYSCTAGVASPNISIAAPLSEDAMARACSLAQVFPVNGTLAKVANLLIESQETRTNELRAFIAAWSALEIFVNSVFKKTYKVTMKDKLSLVDKFLVTASILDSAAAKQDELDFRRLKKFRDGLFHASEGATSRYPVEDILNLLRRYFDLHLAHLENKS